MSNIVKELYDKGIAHPPPWLGDNTHYLTMMGSVAYGVSSDTSDCDVYGFAIPTKDELFPHLRGEIIGFGSLKNGGNRFQNYQEHHLQDPSAMGGKGREYDLSIYNIVDYFQLCMENNPNMVDSMFTPDFCVLHITRIGQMVRDNRRIFLNKRSYHTFKGYAYQQLHKMGNKTRESSKRQKMVEEYGYDVKFGYHIARLADECEQILEGGDLDLQRSREYMKAIRRGEVSEVELKAWFSNKEKQLEALYHSSSLPYAPDEAAIKRLLFNCLEEHYGNLDRVVAMPDKLKEGLLLIESVINKLHTSLHG
jgi:predicted nucleotidyltransferase